MLLYTHYIMGFQTKIELVIKKYSLFSKNRYLKYFYINCFKYLQQTVNKKKNNNVDQLVC